LERAVGNFCGCAFSLSFLAHEEEFCCSFGCAADWFSRDVTALGSVIGKQST
jgi:hypothetical protein